MLNPFKQPTPAQYATRALSEARLLLLQALAAREHADSIVSQKATEIRRLEKFFEDLAAKSSPQELLPAQPKKLRKVLSMLKPKPIRIENVAA